MTTAPDLLVPNAMRLAEYAHRQHDHRRKAPPGEDRPAYFLHLTEVAWLLLDGGVRDDELIAAAFLHDIIEDCDYDEIRLAAAAGSSRVAALVAAVSEPDKGHGWEERQQHAIANGWPRWTIRSSWRCPAPTRPPTSPT